MSTALESLKQCPNKEFVNELFQTSFTCGSEPVPVTIQDKCAEVMEVKREEVGALFVDISKLIQSILFEAVGSKEGLLGLIPASLDTNIKSLIVSVVSANLATWRNQSSNNQLSLPSLKEFDWRIDIKTSSDKVSRMSVPTAIVQMKIEDIPTAKNELAPTKAINFEVTKDTLDTMLDGMGKILEQLNSVSE